MCFYLGFFLTASNRSACSFHTNAILLSHHLFVQGQRQPCLADGELRFSAVLQHEAQTQNHPFCAALDQNAPLLRAFCTHQLRFSSYTFPAHSRGMSKLSIFTKGRSFSSYVFSISWLRYKTQEEGPALRKGARNKHTPVNPHPFRQVRCLLQNLGIKPRPPPGVVSP